MGRLARAAGSPHKFGIEHKGIDSAARGTKGIGPDGQPMKMKQDFGMEGSAMKFRSIREKIASRKQHGAAKDPDLQKKEGESKEEYKARKAANKKQNQEDFDKGLKANRGERQDIAMTQTTEAKRKGGKLKEFTTDEKGNVTMSKVKTRGGKRITKTVDAEGKKTKTVENINKKKKLEKKLKSLDPGDMAVEGTKLSKKKAKLEKKIAKTTKEPKTSNRRAAGETVQGMRHSQTVKKKQKDLMKDFEEKSIKPAEQRNLEKKAKFDAEVAAYEKEGYTVDRKTDDKKPPTKMRRRSAFKKDDDGTVTVDLTKKGKTTTTTTPGTTTPSKPKKKTHFGMDDACSAEYIAKYGKGACDDFKRRNAPKKTPPKTTTTTEPDKKKTLSYTPEKVPEFPGFGTGKFNTLKVDDKNKNKVKKNKNRGVRGDGLVKKPKKGPKANTKKKSIDLKCPFPGLN